MKVMLLCDAVARGFTSAALKIPSANTYVYTLVDMAVSYGVFLKLYSRVGQTGDRKGLSAAIVTWPMVGVVARAAGIFAGFAFALALNCPVGLIDAACMSGASTLAVVVIHLIQSR
jgi:hypothetical protein